MHQREEWVSWAKTEAGGFKSAGACWIPQENWELLHTKRASYSKYLKPPSYKWPVNAPVSSMPIHEPRLAKRPKDTWCSSYLQFCNKSVGSDNIQGRHSKDFTGVVYSMFLENFWRDWDGGVDLVNPRDRYNLPCILRAQPWIKRKIFLPDCWQVLRCQIKMPWQLCW